MGIIKRGILGGFSNKVANVVGTSWKGRAVIKSVPLSVANPRTTPQVNQRNKFKGASQFASPILGAWIKPLFDRFSGDIAGINLWMKENITHFSIMGTPNYPLLEMSKGKMQVPTIDGISSNPPLGALTVAITPTADPTWATPQIEVFALAINTRTGEKRVGTQLVSGTTQANIFLQFDDLLALDTMAIYSAVKRSDGTQVSNSSYASLPA